MDNGKIPVLDGGIPSYFSGFDLDFNIVDDDQSEALHLSSFRRVPIVTGSEKEIDADSFIKRVALLERPCTARHFATLEYGEYLSSLNSYWKEGINYVPGTQYKDKEGNPCILSFYWEQGFWNKQYVCIDRIWKKMEFVVCLATENQPMPSASLKNFFISN